MKMKHSIRALGLAACVTLSVPVSAAQEDTPSAAATDKREQAEQILRQMLPPDIATGMASSEPAMSFGSEMSRLAFENAYMQLWTRPGLTLRERSLVTISMLIAQGNEHELEVHIASGLRNGVTPEELEEVIYQASAYAGFPKAADAMAIATRVVARERARATEGN
jgi:alkylhydroperoxidase/carboxymuconolactone decarboxylase family protein YurZ